MGPIIGSQDALNQKQFIVAFIAIALAVAIYLWYRDKARASQKVAILSGGFRGWEADSRIDITGTTMSRQ